MKQVVSFLALLFALGILAEPVAAQPAEDHLLRGDMYYLEGDYYRAISEYKTFLLTAHDDPRRPRVDLKIAWIYHIADRPLAAGELLRTIALEQRNRPEGWWARLYAAQVAMSSPEPLRARRAFEKIVSDCEGAIAAPTPPAGIDRDGCVELMAHARLGLAHYWARLDDFDRAASELTSIPRGWDRADEARDVADYVSTIEIPQKSPAVAGVLSIVPGLGHFYLEEWGIGVVAMIWNGAFIFATVDSFAAGRVGQGTLLGLLELVWYGGTIFGAVSGAHRFNRDARLIVREGLVEDVERLGVDHPWPARFPVAYPTPLRLELDF